MATLPVTNQPIKNVRDLIMALRKVANNEAPVYLDCGGVRGIAEVQVTDMLPPVNSMVTIVGGRK